MNNTMFICKVCSVLLKRCKSLHYAHLFAHSPSSVLSTMRQFRLRLCWEDRSCESIMDASILITSLAPELRPSICISHSWTRGNAIESGVGVVDRPDDRRQSSGIAHLAPLETFWPQADCSTSLLNATSWLLIVICAHYMHIYVYIYVYVHLLDTRWQGRINSKLCRITLHIFLLLFVYTFNLFKYL